MNVLVLSHMFPNERDSGAGIFVLEQVRALRKAGHTVSVVSPTPWAPRALSFLPCVRKYLPIRRESDVDGFRVKRPLIPTLPRNWGFALSGLHFYLSCRALVRQITRQAPIDVIHAHTIFPDGFAAVLLGRELHIPVVCTAHGSDVNVYPRESRLVRGATRWALRRIPHLIAVSGNLKSQMMALADVREPPVIHNGADASKFMPRDKSIARRELHLNPAARVICFVGYLRAEKAVEYLLQAVALLHRPDIQLCIVGDGPLKAELMQQAEQLKIRQACHFAGATAHDDIPLWLSAADCLVLCSLSEGLPTVLPEAMLCRVPVVATPVGGVPEIIRHGVTGLLVPCRDAAAIASALNSLFSDSTLATTIADCAENFAKGQLTWDMNAQQTFAVYGQAISTYRVSSTHVARAAGPPHTPIKSAR